MSRVDYKKWLCRPIEFKKASCRPVESRNVLNPLSHLEDLERPVLTCRFKGFTPIY